jgi:hypothetical protein
MQLEVHAARGVSLRSGDLLLLPCAGAGSAPLDTSLAQSRCTFFVTPLSV